jgi:hypothetical protein
MVPRFLRTLLQRGASRVLAECEVELLRCGYVARCSAAGCHEHGATTIVRYLDARGNPLRQLTKVCDEHANLIKRDQRRSAVRDLRSP